MQVNGKFYNCKTALDLKSSLIPNAGLGIFATELIPKGAKVCYKGLYTKTEPINCSYTWVLFEYDRNNGQPLIDKDGLRIGSEVGYINAKYHNFWTRYVNCSSSSKTSNISMKQEYKNIFYVTAREILPNEELLVWYGQSYYDELYKSKTSTHIK